MNSPKTDIFNINNDTDFRKACLSTFRYQYRDNPVYHEFVDCLKVNPLNVNDINEIPFMPVEFFRHHRIMTGLHPVEKIFVSSGTTGIHTFSRHFVADLNIYSDSLLNGFRHFYGDPANYIFLSLLPSYSERNNSSLIFMMQRLMQQSKSSLSAIVSGIPELLDTIDRARHENRQILLMGVSFALLDLAENYAPDLSDVIIMETGGMKGRRKEIVRKELHDILKDRLKVNAIHSEYGMTELLSQAYSKGEGLYSCPPWMRILLRDTYDPLTIINKYGKNGGINVIDLANIHSCSFIATGDLGKLHAGNRFEVLGRFDNSDVRGCNLLVY